MSNATPYDVRDDHHFQDLTWILVGVALSDRERLPEIESLLTPTAVSVLPHKQRRLLQAIVSQKGEAVWDALKSIGAERDEERPADRGIDAVMRELRKRLMKHVMLQMQRTLAKTSFHDDTSQFQNALRAMLEEIPRIQSEVDQ